MNYLKVEDLSIEQKLGIVLCGRKVHTPENLEFTLDLIRNHALGAVQLSINESTKELVAKIKEAADYPILIVNDMETGYPRCDLPRVSAIALAACGKPEYYQAFARGIAKYAREDGFNGNWGPVLDIQRCNAPCSVFRHFGDTPEKVAKNTEIMAQTFKENGFFSTGKHYPGGEDRPYDSHMTECLSYVNEEELLDFDLAPYKYLMEKDLLPAIMTRHCIYPDIDPEYPATLSKKVLDILRKEGFDGVYFTDSLAMMGIMQKYGEENVYGLCIAAGIDNILTNYRTPTKTCYEYLKKNFEDGMFTEEQLDQSVARVLALQRKMGEAEKIVPTFTDRDRQLLESIPKDCITAVTEEGLTASIGDPQKRRLFVVVTPMEFNTEDESMEISDKAWYFPQECAKKIRAEFPNSEIVFVPEFPTPKQNETVLVAATDHDEVVFVTFCMTGAYYGTDGLTRRIEALINCINHSGKVSAVVHFGNPLAMEPLDHIKRILFGYNAPKSQGYAIEALAGKIEAKGTLPIEVNLK